MIALTRPLLRTTVAMAVVAFAPTHASAGDRDDCASGVADKVIPSCTRLIASKKVKKTERADFLVKRSLALEAQGNIDGAIADLEQAMDLDPTQGLPYLNRAVYREQRGDMDGAIADYSKAIEIDNSYALAYNYRGNVRANRREFEVAMPDLDRAISLDPKNAAFWANRGSAHVSNGEVERGIVDLDRAIALAPESASHLIDRGFAYYQLGEIEKANADYSAAIELAPDEPLAYSNRASNLLAKGQVVQALADYDKIVELKPESAEYRAARAAAYVVKGEFDKAIADYTKAVELEPGNVDHYINRGHAQWQKLDRAAARADFEKAIEVKREAGLAYLNLAWTYINENQVKKGEEFYHRLLAIAPTTALDHAERGNALAGLKRYSEAQAAYLKALAMDAKLVDAIIGLAQVANATDDTAEAVEQYTAAIGIAPRNASALNGRAWALFKLGRFAQARVDVDKAIAIEPSAAHQYDTRGHILLALGETDEALRDFVRAIDLGNTMPLAYQGRGEAYERLGLRDKALADYRKAGEHQNPEPDQERARQRAAARIAAIESGAELAKPQGEPQKPRPAAQSIADSDAPAGKRVALVVGVGDYASWSKLNNPVRDAKAVAGVLKTHGFQVIERTGADEVTFLGLHDSLADLERESAGADLAFVYYAGHGMQIGDKNILAPSDMPDLCKEPHTRRAIELEQIFRAVKPARAKVVLLDACRNNPFPRCPKKADQSGAGFRALGRVEGTGLLIANATSPGALADDGLSGEGSPFARALVARMTDHPREDLRDLLSNVAADVETSTRSAQTPEVTLRGNVARMCLAGTGCGRQ